ncbi:hypothetical protein [Deinococcus planocerae]|uniref:hypothetical protein n=1 Tax=Deinococcus planocerae TaxID=1737569 RepID=UPI000C7E86A4|nr:hypothetical protein [Deinococcus planocerae]
MNLTIVLVDNKTLYIEKASSEQQAQLRKIITEGRGSFEFVQDQRTYLINATNIIYIETNGLS